MPRACTHKNEKKRDGWDGGGAQLESLAKCSKTDVFFHLQTESESWMNFRKKQSIESVICSVGGGLM